MKSILQLKKELNGLADKKQAKNLQRFFKTGKGEYGEGDVFLGIKVPIQRKIAKKYRDISGAGTQNLLRSKIHEHRLVAIFIFVDKYQKGGEKEKERIFRIYLKNTKYINNWDIVDLSAPKIAGDYLLHRPRTVLYKLARSKNIWERRIAVLATATFIWNNDFKDTLKISRILLKDDQDLIHKATGWMLREVGKRDRRVEEKFLLKHYKKMPRTMLRYAIERFPEKRRKEFLEGKV